MVIRRVLNTTRVDVLELLARRVVARLTVGMLGAETRHLYDLERVAARPIAAHVASISHRFVLKQM